MVYTEKLSHAYFFAKNYIITKGYAEEIDWQDNINYHQLTQQKFLQEISWVIIASGMNDRVVRKIFPKIMEKMYYFQSAELIYLNKEHCYEECIQILNHKGKINAILYVAEYINSYSFELLKNKIQNEGIEFIRTFPYMGQATSYHLAKNIGLDFAKPDRHLVRIAKAIGYECPHQLCEDISENLKEKKTLVDLVLWRYSTLDKNYLRTINWFISKNA